MRRSRGRSGSGAGHFEHHDQGTGFHFVAGRDLDLFHGTGERRRHFHGSLVAFHGDQGLLGFHLVAHFHQDLGHFDFVGADVRHGNVFGRSGGRGSCCCCRFFFRFRRRCSFRCACRFEDHDQFAGFGFIADRHFDLFHHARLRGWHFHGSLVAFHGDQRLFRFNFIADLHQNLGDFDFICTDVRYVDFDRHYSVPLRPDAG